LSEDTTTLKLVPGLHLLKVSEPALSVWVELGDASRAALVVSDASHASIVGQVSEPEAQEVLGLLLWAKIGPDRQVIVPSDAGAWLTTTGSESWVLLSAVEDKTSVPSRSLDEKLQVAGGGTLLVAGTFAAISLRQAATFADQANNATDGRAQQEAISSFQAWDRLWVSTAGISLVGAAALGAGVVLDHTVEGAKSTVSARWIPGSSPGALVAVTGSF